MKKYFLLDYTIGDGDNQNHTEAFKPAGITQIYFHFLTAEATLKTPENRSK